MRAGPLIVGSIRAARNIIFLGFAFAKQNLSLLNADLKEGKPYFTNMYATGLGLTHDVEEKLRRKLTAAKLTTRL